MSLRDRGSILLPMGPARPDCEWARAHNYIGRTYRNRRPWGHRPWTDNERRLLGTLPGAEVAARVGRSATAVRVKRTRLVIPTAVDRRVLGPQ